MKIGRTEGARGGLFLLLVLLLLLLLVLLLLLLLLRHLPKQSSIRLLPNEF